MGEKNNYSPARGTDIVAIPFDNTEDAWFWFIEANKARNEGARFAAGNGLTPRPCEPIDILKVVERLYRNRMLMWDHVLVLNHYGKRLMRPDTERVREARAATLWDQAMDKLGSVLEQKGIVRKIGWADLILEAAE